MINSTCVLCWDPEVVESASYTDVALHEWAKNSTNRLLETRDGRRKRRSEKKNERGKKAVEKERKKM